MKKTLILYLSCCLSLSASSLDKTIQDQTFSLFALHSNALYTGDLRMYRFDHGIWGGVHYAKQSTKASKDLLGSKMHSILAQGGYDHAFVLRGAQNFLGFGVDYSHSFLESGSLQGRANAISLMLYDTFVHHSHFYIHSVMKYTFAMQDYQTLSLNAHSIIGNLEFGYRANFASFLFFQPLVSVGGGFASSVLDLGNHYPIFARAGGFFGLNFFGNVHGDLAIGGFLNSDLFISQDALIERKNLRLLLTLGSNIHIHKNFRLFLGGYMEFFGVSNVDYGASVGMRFLFGQKPHTIKRSPSDARNLKSIQQEMLHQAQLSRQRVQERTYLKPYELQERYETQDRRDSPFVQDEIKYDKRQREIRERSRWIDTRQNEQNYLKRDFSSIHQRDMERMKSYYRREIERKYGK
ncbi:autotransporter outer membrane beta-barrel domain-containing protein [Helicobacter pametensis]|uniref:autotransporter outer membrane beta-barrel domain-containing protein n=1 Tax=Helicobacter pametensis TaxID=95149 RepID=UPI000487AFB0|nr:autotransporter outer membrane beta-barrel domain-containing protein [Helicobacter pametensis]